MSDISQNIFIPLPISLQITKSMIDMNPPSTQTEYYNKIIKNAEIQINDIYYVKNVGQTNKI